MDKWAAPTLVGRVGRALGFRWVFPVGTLPVPWHPAFLPLVLASLAAWTITRIVALAVGVADGVGGTVVALATGFVALGLLMSVPVLAWVVLALGGRLVQALLALAAMLLLAVSVAIGDDPVWLAALPAAYAGVWAYQAVGGRIALASLQAAARRFEPLDARGHVLVLPPDVDPAAADDLLVRCGAGAVWVRSRHDGDGGRCRALISAEQADDLRAAARGTLPADVTVDSVDGHSVVAWTGALPGPDALVVHRTRAEDHRVLLGDELWRLEVGGRTLVSGRASLVLPVPLLNAFHWVSLTSRSHWVVGYGRGRARPVGGGDADARQLFAEVEEPRPGEGPWPLAALDAAWRRVADRDAAVDRLRTGALRGRVDTSAERRTISELERGVNLLGPDAPQVLATWLEGARSGREERTPGLVARLVMLLSDDEIVRHGSRLVDAFNSRKLALRWQLSPDLDVAPLPRDLYRFGDHAGFGLALDMPALYVRLGDLLPPFRPMVAELQQEMDLGEDVRSALARWSGGRTENGS